MKVLLAFDSYKGSLASYEAGSIAAQAILSVMPNASCEVVPMADGGEGTVAAIVTATGGTLETIRIRGPLGEESDAEIGLVRDEDGHYVAVLEVAGICGLTMVGESGPDPLKASSYGVGEAIIHLLDKGIRRFVIGLGGSATNDGGMGMLAALGAEFCDSEGMLLTGSGGDLLRVASLQLDRLDARLMDCHFTIATDVSNPLCGPQGATMVYGRQKGVTNKMSVALDEAMNRYARMLEQELNEQVSSQKLAGAFLTAVDKSSLQERTGAGAAGGLGFALITLGGKVVSGADWIIEKTQLAERAELADWIITGEGRSDQQTLYGKLPIKVAEAAKRAGAGCILISGSLGDGIQALAPYFQGCFSIVNQPSELEQCMEQAKPLLEQTVREVFRLIHFMSEVQADQR